MRSGTRNDRKDDTRGVLRIVIYRVLGDAPAPVLVERFPSIGIDVEPRKIAARYVETNSVTAAEHQRRGVHLDREFHRASRHEHFGVRQRLAIAGADDAVSNVEID